MRKGREEGGVRMLGMAGIVPGDCGQEERSSTPTCREAWRAAENNAAVTEKECSAVEKTQQRHRAPRMNAMAENNNAAASPPRECSTAEKYAAAKPPSRCIPSKNTRQRIETTVVTNGGGQLIAQERRFVVMVQLHLVTRYDATTNVSMMQRLRRTRRRRRG